MMDCLSEKQIKALDKANTLLSWFDGRELPKTLKIDQASTITCMESFLDTHKAILNYQKPLTRSWTIVYMRVYNVKQILIKLK